MQDSALGDLKSTLAKIRKAVHKVHPRELSPTRMLEKYASDTKKKSARKLSTLQTASEEKNAADEAALAQKIQNLKDTALPAFTLPLAPPSGKSSAPAPTSQPLLVAGLLGVGALALAIGMRKR